MTQTSASRRIPSGISIGRSNRPIAWVGFCLGAGSGLLMGLWSFDGPVGIPGWLGAYDDTARRLLRLGHIAFFGIGYLNLLLVHELPTLKLGLAAKAGAAHSMNFANVFLPSLLIAAAVFPPAKYLLALPATSAFMALCIAAWGACARTRRGAAGRMAGADGGSGPTAAAPGR